MAVGTVRWATTVPLTRPAFDVDLPGVLVTRSLPLRLLVCLVAFGVVGSGSLPSSAESIKEAREQRERARAEQAEAAAQVELLEAQTEEVAAALADIEAAVAYQQAQVDGARSAVTAAEALAAEREQDLVATAQLIEQARLEAVDFAVEAYVDGAEGNQGTSWLETEDLVLGARMAVLLAEVSADRGDAIDVLRGLEARQDVLAEQAVDSRAKADELRGDLERDLVILEGRLVVQQDVRAEYARRLANWRDEVDALEEEDRKLTADIRALTVAALGVVPGSPAEASLQGFIMPVAGSVGSGFGPRVHPIYGRTRMHNGVDMSGRTGDPIYAAKGGEILWAGARGGYGNVVIIDHGEGMSTLYAHQSRILVSVGERVDRGEVIGAIGSTGLSTGPHLHFEFRYYGEPRDPLAILPG